MSGKWKEIVSRVAPGLGAAIGGPFGAIAGKAIGAVLMRDGKEPTEENLEAAVLNATPADLLKLKEADRAFQLEMKKLDIDIFRAEIQDRASARALFSVNYLPQMILSGLFIVFYFVVLVLIITGKTAQTITADMLPVFHTILGVLTASVTAIMAFWFGSSFGSKEKTAALAAAPAIGEK